MAVGPEHRLVCRHPGCGRVHEDLGFPLACDDERSGGHGPALLEAVYERRQLTVRRELPGVFGFLDWLPTSRRFLRPAGELGRPLAYVSHGLAGRLGLARLTIAFSGFWPERGG